MVWEWRRGSAPSTCDPQNPLKQFRSEKHHGSEGYADARPNPSIVRTSPKRLYYPWQCFQPHDRSSIRLFGLQRWREYRDPICLPQPLLRPAREPSASMLDQSGPLTGHARGERPRCFPPDPQDISKSNLATKRPKRRAWCSRPCQPNSGKAHCTRDLAILRRLGCEGRRTAVHSTSAPFAARDVCRARLAHITRIIVDCAER